VTRAERLDAIEAAVRAAVATAINAEHVTAGWPPMVVQTGVPLLSSWPEYVTAFRQPDGRIEGWFVLVGFAEMGLAFGWNELHISATLTGFRSRVSAGGSLSAFRKTVGALFEAPVLVGGTLGGLVEFVEGPLASRLESGALIEDREMGDVICHVTELGLTARQAVAAVA